MLPASRRIALITAALVTLATGPVHAQPTDPAQEAAEADVRFGWLRDQVWEDLDRCHLADARAGLNQMSRYLERMRLESDRAQLAGKFATSAMARARSRYLSARGVFQALQEALAKGECRPDPAPPPRRVAPPPAPLPRATAVPPAAARIAPIARDLMRVAGDWAGADWGTVVIRARGDGQFEGTYTGTFGQGPGRFTFSRTAPGSYAGTWFDPDGVHKGEFTLRDLPGNPPRLSVTWKSTDHQPRGGTSQWTREQR